MPRNSSLTSRVIERLSVTGGGGVASSCGISGEVPQRPRCTPGAVLITGMHRSGTSALTRVLNLHGVFLGQSLLQADPANERGYWEHDGLWRLDERILAALGREWSDPGRLPERWWERPEVRVLAQELIVALRRDFGGTALWGVKDPRICRLIPLWRESVRQSGAREHFVIVLRRPGEVAASLEKRNGMSPERARALWLRYLLEAERDTRGASRAFITYDRLLADWRAALAQVVEGTGLDLVAAGDEAAAQVEEFLSPQLRHHRASPGSGTGVLAERAEAVYEILAAEGGAPDVAALDRVAEELDALEDAFAGGGIRTIVPVAEPAGRDRGIPYREWCNIFGLHESDGQVMAERMMQQWRYQPAIHLIAVLRRGEGVRLAATVDSLSTQIYAGWGLTVLAEEPCPDPLFMQIPNLEWREWKEDRAAVLNAIVGESESDWVGLLCPGDRLAQQALFACADRLQGMGGARWLYTDWDRLDEAGERCDPRFERDVDLDWLRTGECLGGLWLIRRDVLLELGGFADRGPEEARDLALRVFERFGAGVFGHVDEVLCHRPASGCEPERPTDIDLYRAVLSAHLRRMGESGDILDGLAPGTLRIRYAVHGEPGVSVIVETLDDLRVLEKFIDTLKETTEYPNLELVVVDCGSRDEDTEEYCDALRTSGVVVVSAPEGAGRAEAWNIGARAAHGEYLVFADRRGMFVQKDWLATLLGHAQHTGVGIVAPRIVGADTKVVHSTFILGFGGPARDAFQGLSVWDPGYGGRALTEQGCSAVPPVCLLISRACFEEIGGFDAERFSSDWFSVDFCLRSEAAGHRTIWTPYALVGWQAPEPARETGDPEQEAAMYERWLPHLARDPFYHRNLDLSATAFQSRVESTARWNPAFHERPRILGVPVDTLGCGEYRILAPLNTLDDAARAHCGFLPPQEGTPRMPSVTELARLAPDTLLLQAALDDVHLEALRRYRRFNRVFRVFDIEDLKTAVPEKNSRRKLLLRNIKARTRRALALCDRLLVTTEPLAEAHRGLIDDICVMPIYLSRKRWGGIVADRNEGGRPRVGWAGAQQHQGDLEILLPVVEATAREVDWVFFGMCPQALRPYVREVHDMVPFAEYPRRLAALALDLAVAPLEDHPFNVAKSNLRLLEYGALGWPVVCTDLEPYRGAPVMRVPNESMRWIEAIRERVHDLDAARAEGARLREWVLGGWMLEDHLDEWLDALTPGDSVAAWLAVAQPGAGGGYDR